MAKKLPFDLQVDEAVLRNEFGVWIRGGLKNVIGNVYLTNRRLLFVRQNAFLGALFGLLGVLLGRLLDKWMGKVLLDLPLKNISSFEHTVHAFNKKVILFHTAQGEIKLGVGTAFEQWEPVLKEAMKRK